jgi:hypothetical protein
VRAAWSQYRERPGDDPGNLDDCYRFDPVASGVLSKLRMCDLKGDLNAEDAEVFAKARREVPYFAYLCENLCALCV